jgi:hypothetical protein
MSEEVRGTLADGFRVTGGGPFNIVGRYGSVVYDLLDSRQEADAICTIVNEGFGPDWEVVEPILRRRMQDELLKESKNMAQGNGWDAARILYDVVEKEINRLLERGDGELGLKSHDLTVHGQRKLAKVACDSLQISWPDYEREVLNKMVMRAQSKGSEVA